jgi:hypothetical protein
MMYSGAQYIKMGLLIGKHNPQLAERLMMMDTLDEMRVEINTEIGTNIQKGDNLDYVLNAVEMALRD